MQEDVRSRPDVRSTPRCLDCGRLDPLGTDPGAADLAVLGSLCPDCGCDLDERPPRSYAQMEGLDRPHGSRADLWAAALEARLVERWVGTVFLLLLAGILVLDLLIS